MALNSYQKKTSEGWRQCRLTLTGWILAISRIYVMRVARDENDNYVRGENIHTIDIDNTYIRNEQPDKPVQR